MTQVELALMTWREAEAARDRGAVVLVPIGTHEQNGLVCPLATDSLIVFEVAKRIAQQTESLVAPLISYGYSGRHRNFTGTISLRPDTLRRLIRDVCEDLINSGFNHILLVNDHLTNEPLMEHAAKEIRERLGVVMGWINPMEQAEKVGKDLFPNLGSAHGHGDERVASMLLSFTPESVRLDAARPFEGRKDFEGVKVVATDRVKVGEGVFGMYLEVRDTSEVGGNGNPADSDPERGAELIRRVVAMCSDYVRAFSKMRVTGCQGPTPE